MAHRPLAFTLAVAGTTTALGALWPGASQLAEQRLRAAATPEERVRALEARWAIAPGDPTLLVRLAESYERAGRPEAGLALIEREAARRAPGRAVLALGRRLALAIGQPARALALCVGPHHHPRVGELTSMVDLALMANDLATARRLQAELVRARPHDTTALARLEDLALMAGDVGAATRTQQALFARQPDARGAQRLASLRLQAGDPAGALAALEACPSPDAPIAYHHRAAQLAEWARLPARAVPHLRILYARRPDLALGRRLLAALAESRDPDTAAFALALATAHPEDDALRREVAARLVEDGKPHDALALFEAAVRQRPGDVGAHDALVDFALGRALPAAAIAELGRWVAAHPRDAVSLHRLAEVLTWQGRQREAWEVYERLFSTCRVPDTLAASWRGAWAAIATPADDTTPTGLANLAALAAAEPARAAWRRRLALAHWAMGEREAAITEQRQLADLVGATPDDEARLGNWLLAMGRIDEGLARLRQDDAAAPLAVPLLADAAYQAAGAARWGDAGYFFERLAGARPRDRGHWEALASAREHQGDWAGAARAWRRRLALGTADGPALARYLYLLRRAGRGSDALAFFAAQPLEVLDATALAEGADLAREQGDAIQEERALRARLGRKALDVPARLRLAELLDGRGAHREAERLVEAALALAPDDARVLYALAARRVCGGRAGAAATVVARLAELPSPGPEVLALLADFYEPRDPARAAAALDALHRLTGGDAAGWLRRGELARRLGDAPGARMAWERAVQLASRGPAAAAVVEVRARALARLGRDPEALAAWEELAARSPYNLAAAIAIARYHLDHGHPALAAAAIERAHRLGPNDREARQLRADWLEAMGRPGEALPVVAALRAEHPTAALALAEARLRGTLGERMQARRLAEQATELDASLEPLARPFRQAAAVTPRLFWRDEHQDTFETAEVGLEAALPLTDHATARLDARRLQWSGVAAPAEEVGLGGEQQLGAWALDGRVALTSRDGESASPLGHVGVRWEDHGASAGLAASEERWQDAPGAVLQAGREHRFTASAGWHPTPALRFDTRASVGHLALSGADVGTSTGAEADAAWQPLATVPMTLAYQFWHRGWGEAGALVGLPAAVDVHTLLARYDATLGPLQLELAPGFGVDGATAAMAPTVSATLAFAPRPDAAITLSGAAAGRAFALGLPGTYERLELAGSWYF